MNVHSRIPSLTELTLDGAARRFSEMQQRGILFRPDDNPADIKSIADGSPTFNAKEIAKVHFLVEEMFTAMGDGVYDAAYPSFMHAIGNLPA